MEPFWPGGCSWVGDPPAAATSSTFLKREIRQSGGGSAGWSRPPLHVGPEQSREPAPGCALSRPARLLLLISGRSGVQGGSVPDQPEQKADTRQRRCCSHPPPVFQERNPGRSRRSGGEYFTGVCRKGKPRSSQQIGPGLAGRSAKSHPVSAAPTTTLFLSFFPLNYYLPPPLFTTPSSLKWRNNVLPVIVFQILLKKIKRKKRYSLHLKHCDNKKIVIIVYLYLINAMPNVYVGASFFKTCGIGMLYFESTFSEALGFFCKSG